jgi:small subunit ribosomal protein S7
MRRKRNHKREYEPDVIYGSVALTRFLNQFSVDGKTSVATKVMYKAMDIIKEKTGENPIDVFNKALENVSPVLEVRSRRIGGANYQVPREVRGERKFMLTKRWIIDAARKRKGVPMSVKLADELMAAAKKEGEAMKKRHNTQRMAEANRAFAHFAW